MGFNLVSGVLDFSSYQELGTHFGLKIGTTPPQVNAIDGAHWASQCHRQEKQMWNVIDTVYCFPHLYAIYTNYIMKQLSIHTYVCIDDVHVLITLIVCHKPKEIH